MTAHVQGSNVLDVLKKKMRATKEESEKYKEDCEDLHRKLQVEIMRREEVNKYNDYRASLRNDKDRDVVDHVLKRMSHTTCLLFRFLTPGPFPFPFGACEK